MIFFDGKNPSTPVRTKPPVTHLVLDLKVGVTGEGPLDLGRHL